MSTGEQFKDVKIKSRPCHDCGKLGSDYLCRSCWVKRQGFSPREMEDSNIILGNGANNLSSSCRGHRRKET